MSADFYHSLVVNLATVLNVEGVYVGELIEGSSARLRTVAAVWRRRISARSEQQLRGTASGQVLSDGMFACSKDVLRIFPHDSYLKKVGAEGYAGIRLSDSAGTAAGRPRGRGERASGRLQLAKSVLETFAPRVAENSRKDGATIFTGKMRSAITPSSPAIRMRCGAWNSNRRFPSTSRRK